MQKLISRTEFAELADVNPSTITRLCRTILKNTVVGKRVDRNHPEAINYLNDQSRVPNHSDQSPAPGIDPLYEAAIETCNEAGRVSPNLLQRKLRIGYDRACKIIEIMEVAGIKPGKVPPPPGKQKRTMPASSRVTGKKVDPIKNIPPPPPDDPLIDIPDDIRMFVDMSLRELVLKFGTDTRFVDWLKATKMIEDINEKRLKNAEKKGELISRKLVKIGIIDQVDQAHSKLLSDGSKTIARRVTAMHGADRSLEDIELFVIDQISSFIRPMKTKMVRALKNG